MSGVLCGFSHPYSIATFCLSCCICPPIVKVCIDDRSYSSGVPTIYYDQTPHDLTLGQLSRTYCYDNGALVTSLRPQLHGNWYYPTDTFTTQGGERCINPYDTSPNAPAPHHLMMHIEFGRRQQTPLYTRHQQPYLGLTHIP